MKGQIHLIIAVLFFMVILSSCKKDEDIFKAPTTTCRIETAGRSDDDTLKYYYSGDTITHVWATDSSYLGKYYYDSLGKFVRWENFEGSYGDSSFYIYGTFSYNADGTMYQEQSYLKSGGVFHQHSIITYNYSNGKLVEWMYSTTNSTLTEEYTYDVDGNIVTTLFSYDSPATQLTETFYYEYDTHHNPYYNMDMYNDGVYLSTNNVVKETHIDWDGDTLVTTYAYQYNSDNYPVSAQVAGPFDSYTLNWTYTCQ